MRKTFVVLVALAFVIGVAAAWTSTVPTFPKPAAVSAHRAGTGTTVLWVGDSYPSGFGTSQDAKTAYSTVAARDLGWNLRLDAGPGRGFLPTGRGIPFGDTLTGGTADVVVIDGGRNDEGRTLAEEEPVVLGYIADVRRLYPHAKLVLVVPGMLGATQTIRAIMAKIYATVPDATIIDQTHWWDDPDPRIRSTVPTVLLHPNDLGAVLAARKFAQQLACVTGQCHVLAPS